VTAVREASAAAPASSLDEQDPAPSPAGPYGATGERRLRAWAGRLGWVTAGALALGVGYLPASQVPIIADDLSALQEVYALSNGNLWRAIVFGVTEGTAAGHFNPIGQALGATYHFTAYAASAALGVNPQYFDVLTYLVMIALTVAGAASVVVWGLSRSARLQPRFWPLFALICAVTAATLQIHTPYANDPVVSFGPAGWGSAAIGFWTIALALRATSPGVTGRRWLIATSLMATSCVWYYEMLVSAVAATALALVLTATLAADRSAVRRRCLVLLGTAVALPAALFVLGRVLAAPPSESSYAGTTVALGSDALGTWWTGMLGAVPGAGWSFLTAETGPAPLTSGALTIGALLCLLVGAIGFAWSRSPARDGDATPRADLRARRSPVSGLVAVVFTFWALATAAHSVAVKYIRELQNVGQVYLFYAVGVVAVATLVAIALTALRPRARSAALLALVPVAGAFVLAQVSVNVVIAERTRAMVPYNGPLMALSTDPDAPESERCEVLEKWMDQGFAPGYVARIRIDIQENYERKFGERFCSTIEAGRR
jgi:hypothetical protein